MKSSTLTHPSVLHEITKVVFTHPNKVGYLKEPIDDLKEGEFFVKTLYSGISTGTELTQFLGTNPKLSEGWDETLRLFRGNLEPAISEVYPILKGEMVTGIVTDSRHSHIKKGTYVATKYGPVTGSIMRDGDFFIELPPDLDSLLGIFVAKIGPVCINGVLYAADEVQRNPLTSLKESLKDQRIIIFGAGMIGLMCGLIARWAGAEQIAVVDGIKERLDVAEKLGFITFSAHPDLPLEVKSFWSSSEALDTGADLALQCTGSDYLLAQALSCLREQGTVVDLGFYQQSTSAVFLGKEFHHNIVRHVCAQIGSIPRHQKEFWDKPRLSLETINFMREYGDVFKEHLITHQLPFSRAQEAFERLASRDPDMLQVVLFPDK